MTHCAWSAAQIQKQTSTSLHHSHQTILHHTTFPPTYLTPLPPIVVNHHQPPASLRAPADGSDPFSTLTLDRSPSSPSVCASLPRRPYRGKTAKISPRPLETNRCSRRRTVVRIQTNKHNSSRISRRHLLLGPQATLARPLTSKCARLRLCRSIRDV